MIERVLRVAIDFAFGVMTWWREFGRRAPAFAGLVLVCCASSAALGQTPTQSTDVPLNYVFDSNGLPRLAIYVGINGGPPKPYLFDTGSTLFNAAYNPATWGGFDNSSPTVPTSTVPNGNNIQLCYSGSTPTQCRGYTGNIVQVPTLSFYASTATAGSMPAATFTASPGFQINAVSSYTDFTTSPATNDTFPGYFTLPGNNNDTPVQENLFFGVFGARDSVDLLNKNCSAPNCYVSGGVFGQAIVPGAVAQGFVVSANGQTNLSGVNPPTGNANVNLNGTIQAVSTCNPCVTVGLTPQLIGQFATVALPTQNPALSGLVPWISSTPPPPTFSNPYGGATGNNSAPTDGTNFQVTVTQGVNAGATITAPGLLDTGTKYFNLAGGLPSLVNQTIAVVGLTPSGGSISGLSSSDSYITGSGAYQVFSSGSTSTIGIPFFMQNSVMFDLSDEVIGYTSYFVTDANQVTTTGGMLKIDGTSAPIGLAGVISGPGDLVIDTGGNVQLSATNTYTGATTIKPTGMLLISGPGSIAASSGVEVDGTFDISRSWAPVQIQALTGFGQIYLGGQNLAIYNASGTFSGIIADGGAYPAIGGSLTIASGTQTLGGVNTYTGATAIMPGAQLNLSGAGSIATSAGLVNFGRFDASGATSPVSLQSLGGSGEVYLGSSNLTLTNAATVFSGVIADGGVAGGSGASVTITGGSQGLDGVNTYTGGTTISGGALMLNGSVASDVAVGSVGVLGGTGTVFGNLRNDGLVSPGTPGSPFTVTGSYTQSATGILYTQVSGEQSNQLSVGGTATLHGGTVLAVVAPGSYGARNTYTILRASGGVNGTYTSVSGGSTFLLPSLSYDANDVYLTLQAGNFGSAAQTPTQAAVGRVFDVSAPSASGDFSSVIGSLAQLPASQVAQALTALSGQNYSGFASGMVQGAQLFMNNFASQGGSSGGGGSASAGGGSPRVALAQACEVACETTEPAQWGAWGGGVGGFGTLGVGSPAGAMTYSMGGFAAGLDRQVTDRLRVGVTTGYTSGTQSVQGFQGSGRSNTVLAGVYGDYSAGAVYADLLAGYAYSTNQMTRTISFPGVQRQAYGQVGANQFLGQLESGYRFDLGGPGQGSVTPFGRLQVYTASQGTFSEWGAQSLDLTVQSQTTTSVRSVVGAQVGSQVEVGLRDRLGLQVRLGWSHEYADTSRPVTAALAGAPTTPFTTYGSAAQRDGVLLGLSASTAVVEATSVYVRYEGTISGQDNAQAVTAGLRMTW